MNSLSIICKIYNFIFHKTGGYLSLSFLLKLKIYFKFTILCYCVHVISQNLKILQHMFKKNYHKIDKIKLLKNYFFLEFLIYVSHNLHSLDDKAEYNRDTVLKNDWKLKISQLRSLKFCIYFFNLHLFESRVTSQRDTEIFYCYANKVLK